MLAMLAIANCTRKPTKQWCQRQRRHKVATAAQYIRQKNKRQDMKAAHGTGIRKAGKQLDECVSQSGQPTCSRWGQAVWPDDATFIFGGADTAKMISRDSSSTHSRSSEFELCRAAAADTLAGMHLHMCSCSWQLACTVLFIPSPHKSEHAANPPTPKALRHNAKRLNT